MRGSFWTLVLETWTTFHCSSVYCERLAMGPAGDLEVPWANQIGWIGDLRCCRVTRCFFHPLLCPPSALQLANDDVTLRVAVANCCYLTGKQALVCVIPKFASHNFGYYRDAKSRTYCSGRLLLLGTVRVILGVYVCYIYVKSQDRVYNERLVQREEGGKKLSVDCQITSGN